jgi:hypothetical protein
MGARALIIILLLQLSTERGYVALSLALPVPTLYTQTGLWRLLNFVGNVVERAGRLGTTKQWKLCLRSPVDPGQCRGRPR